MNNAVANSETSETFPWDHVGEQSRLGGMDAEVHGVDSRGKFGHVPVAIGIATDETAHSAEKLVQERKVGELST